jgi:hypothetical protein
VILRTVLLTSLLCGITGYLMLRRQARRHELDMRQAGRYWRNVIWQQIGPQVTLTDQEVQEEFDAITARWDYGLDILEREEGTP